MTFEQTLIITIISSCITGILAILGVVLTLRQNNKQLSLQMKERQEDKKQAIIDNRPEFEIISRKCCFSETGYASADDIDIDVMATIFGENYKKSDFEKHLYFVEYTLRNIGISRVEFLDLYFYDNNVELLDMTRNDIDKFIDNPNCFPTATHLRYAGPKVKHNEDIKIRIWYRSDNIIRRQFVSYPSFIGIKAFDKRYWYQNFDTPYDGLEDSVLIDERKYYHLLYRKDSWPSNT